VPSRLMNSSIIAVSVSTASSWKGIFIVFY
jgi:hypothetical protein